MALCEEEPTHALCQLLEDGTDVEGTPLSPYSSSSEARMTEETIAKY